MSCRARSPTLQENLSRVRGTSQIDPSTSLDEPSVANPAEKKLWSLLQQEMYHPEACAKLKPLKIDDRRTVAKNESKLMLDERIQRTEVVVVEGASCSPDVTDSMGSMLLLEDLCSRSQSDVGNLLNDHSEYLEGRYDPFAEDQKPSISINDHSEIDFEESLLAEDQNPSTSINNHSEDDLEASFLWDDLGDEEVDLSWNSEDEEDLFANIHGMPFESPISVGSVRNEDEILEDLHAEPCPSGDSFKGDEILEDAPNATSPSNDSFMDLEEDSHDQDLLFNEGRQDLAVQGWEMLLES